MASFIADLTAAEIAALGTGDIAALTTGDWAAFDAEKKIGRASCRERVS
jgi:hypothetical protein